MLNWYTINDPTTLHTMKSNNPLLLADGICAAGCIMQAELPSLDTQAYQSPQGSPSLTILLASSVQMLVHCVVKHGRPQVILKCQLPVCLDYNLIKTLQNSGHFACLCRGFEFYEVKKNIFVIIFQKENGNTFTLFIIFIVKSLQKEQNSTNLLL